MYTNSKIIPITFLLYVLALFINLNECGAFTIPQRVRCGPIIYNTPSFLPSASLPLSSKASRTSRTTAGGARATCRKHAEIRYSMERAMAQREEEEFRGPRSRKNRQVRMRDGAPSDAERELRQMKYQDEEEDEDEYYYDDEDDYEDDGYDNDGRVRGRGRSSEYKRQEKEFEGGNFWTNPVGSMDVNRDSSSFNRRKRKSPSSSSAISYRRERDDYGPSSGSRSSSVPRLQPTRRTFRSGNPPPPNVVKDLYDKIFWYGFDPDETTSAADKTVFGGTKGKFNGLGLLQGVNDEYAENRGRGSLARGQRGQRQYYEDDDDDDYEYYEDNRNDNRYKYDDVDDGDDWDEYYDDDEDDSYYDNSKASIRNSINAVPVNSLRTSSRRETSTSLPPQSSGYDDDIDDFKYSDKEPISPPVPRQKFERDSRAPAPARRSSTRKPRRRNGRSMQSRENSSSRSGRRQKKKKADVSSWFEDDIEEISQNDGTRRKRKEDDQSPLFNVLDSIFNVDPEEVKSQAEDYNRKLGLDKSKRRRRPSAEKGKNRERDGGSARQRKGYAYRYEKDNDDDEYYDENGEDTRDQTAQIESDVIDVEATVQELEPPKSNTQKIGRPQRPQSWEDRASAYERVPPKGIKAWGPDGEIDDGIDARTFAALSAMDEIEKCKEVFRRKEQAVSFAEKDLLAIKKEASELKKKILLQDDRRRVAVIRDQLRLVKFDIEESARALRRAKGEALSAIDKLEGIELRHWALLRQYEADQELGQVKDISKSIKDETESNRPNHSKEEDQKNDNVSDVKEDLKE